MLTDLKLHARPALPALPKKGSTYVDPVFGQRILRVTDEADGISNETAYSYWPTFNKNATFMLVHSRDATGNASPFLYSFDHVKFTSAKMRPMFKSPPKTGGLRAEDLIWSHVNPHQIIGHVSGGTDIYAYDVVKDHYTLLMSVDEPGNYLDQGSLSVDDQVYAATLKSKKDYTVVGYIAVNMATKKVLLRVADTSFDEVQIDKSGKYLTHKTGQDGAVYDLVKTPPYKMVLTDGPPDLMMGHSDSGTGMIIGLENFNGCLLGRQLALPHDHYVVFDVPKVMGRWQNDQHISLLADNESWFSAAFYQNTFTPPEAPCDNEILLITSNGSGAVKRLCHHRGGGPVYEDAPRANRSLNGRWIAYTSTWEGTLGTGRRDFFVVDTK